MKCPNSKFIQKDKSMKGKMYHVSNKPYCMDAAGIDFQVCDYYILLITTSAVAKKKLPLIFYCRCFSLLWQRSLSFLQWQQNPSVSKSASSNAPFSRISCTKDRKESFSIYLQRGCAGRQRQSAEYLHFILIVQVSARESQFMVICLSQTEVFI